jgi:hypothetical protein
MVIDKEYKKLTAFIEEINCSKCINLTQNKLSRSHFECNFNIFNGSVFEGQSTRLVCTLFEKKA